MDVTRTAFGSWNGGRFMSFGEPLEEGRWMALVQRAYERGVRTFVTADVYGLGEADRYLGRALAGLPRQDYALVGMVGHDFYSGKRDGAKGYPRFSDPRLRSPKDFAGYLQMATEKSLERCQANRFDALLLHNPDSIGYSSDAVWNGMQRLRETGLTDRLGIAPGPANGFTLDILLCLERFGPLMDWAMIILNPFEPWPGAYVLPAAVQQEVKVMTRVVDYGGLFHDDVRPNHTFGPSDHRSYRPPGWVDAGNERLEKLRPYAEKYGLTLLQLACLWNLHQPNVHSVIPTLIQEVGSDAKAVEDKLEELARVPEVSLNASDVEAIRQIGDNSGCMALKGANVDHSTAPEPDRWGLNSDLEQVAKRWGIDPARDLVMTH